MEHEVKFATTPFTMKADGEPGAIEAVFSTFGVVDRAGDIVDKGAIPDGISLPMVWSHDWSRMIGKGTVRVEPDRAVFDGQLFLNTAAGNDAYETIKSMDNLLEYSWGFRVLDADYAERDGSFIRIIKSTEPFEVSPVLVGEGLGTHTLSLKYGQPFSDQSAAVLAAVSDLVARSRSLADLRTKEGRTLSTANRGRLGEIRDAMKAAAGDLDTILKETEPAKALDGLALLTAFNLIDARFNGVID